MRLNHPFKSTAPIILGVVMFVALVVARGQAQLPDGVEVLRSDETVLELRIEPQITWSATSDGELVPDVSDGAAVNMGDAGAPLQIRMNIPVGLPSSDGASLEVVAVERGTPQRGILAPVPQMIEDEEGLIGEERVRDEAKYAEHVPSSDVVSFRYGGVAGGLHIGELTIAPLEFSAAREQIEVIASVTVRIRYGATPPRSERRSDVSRAVLSTLPNAGQAESWSIRSPQDFAARPASVPDAQAWIRVKVGAPGLYRVTRDDLEGTGVNVNSISNIAVYGGRGVPLPEHVDSALTNSMNQVPAIVERSEGSVSGIMFYATGTTAWEYRDFDADSVPRRINNPYASSNSYIIAIDGAPSKDFPLALSPSNPTAFPEYGIDHILFEEDLTNAIAQGNSGNGGGRDWFGTSFIVDDFRPEEKRVFTKELFGLERSYPVTYRMRMGNHAPSSGSGTASVEQNGTAIGTFDVPWYGSEQQAANATERVYETDANLVPTDNRSLLGITYTNNGDATGYLDWYELHYGRRLTAKDNEISFESPTGDAVAEYSVAGFNTNNLIGLDVTDPTNPQRLNPSSTDGGTYVFTGQLSTDPTDRRRYWIGSPNDARSVSNVRRTSFGGLRSMAAGADILVITHPDLESAAQEYVSYRNSRGSKTALRVSTEEIYTEFSNGMLDPTAIRDFVAHAYHNWTNPPRYLLLMGDGNYDYRNIASQQKQFVPVYEHGETNSYNDITVSVTDDYFARVDGNDFYIDLAVGRIPVTSAQDGGLVVEKIKAYENGSRLSDWRRRVLLAADDAVPLGDGGGFVGQSEALERDFIPGWIEAEKVYLPQYPTEQGVRREKPGATQDLRQWINSGSLVVNWVGHGNAKVWAHEHILEKDTFVPQLNNDSALTLLMAVTCNFGRFDNPNEVSGGELFLSRKGGGAAAVLATTRAVYISDNERLMRAYFGALFLRDSISNRFLPLGDALLSTKLRAGAQRDNDEKYLLFGDPAMHLNLPYDSVAIRSVNDISVDSDTAVVGALSLVTIEGSIHNRVGDLQDDFNGTAIVTFYDADQHSLVVDEDGREFDVVDKGGQLFKGPAIVEDGRFTAKFRLPKDIAYDSSQNGRIYVYAFNETRDAAGASTNVKVFGSDTALVEDGEGPEIDVFVDDRTFRSGDVVSITPNLIVDLEDGSGINASGAGIGHRIEAWIGDDPEPIDLTPFYTTSPTDYRFGTAERELLELEPGEYRVRVRAWDIFNNPAETTAWFRILEAQPEELVITDVANFPNPMGRETDFLFRHNQTQPLDVSIEIFAPSGRKIRTLERRNVTDRYVRVHWNGHDVDGRRIANGVYFYRLTVSAAGIEEGSTQSVEVIEKVAVAR